MQISVQPNPTMEMNRKFLFYGPKLARLSDFGLYVLPVVSYYLLAELGLVQGHSYHADQPASPYIWGQRDSSDGSPPDH